MPVVVMNSLSQAPLGTTLVSPVTILTPASFAVFAIELVNGLLGDHGAAILCARGDMALDTPVESDCACLHGLVAALLRAAPGIRFIRDATRGGVATVLNEVADASQVAIEIDEAATPVREEVKAFCEILGLDPLYLANEGKIVVVAPPGEAEAALAALRDHPLGSGAAAIGRVTQGLAGRVTRQIGRAHV